jgi:uncharacterized protein (DUF1697 family)
VFEGLGFDDVRAVISSGNVLFAADGTAAALERRIETALLEHLGAPCTTILRSRRQIDLLLRSGVFDGREDVPTARWNVTFLKRAPKGRPADVDLDCGPGARVVATSRQAVFTEYDSTREPVPDVMRVLERVYGKAITTRTWQTVERIARAFDR